MAAPAVRHRWRSLPVAVALLASCAGGGDEDQASRRFAAFVERFVAEEARAPGDLSRESFEAELSGTRALLEELRAIPLDRLGAEERLDWRFAESLLAGREIEQAEIRLWTKDPRVYMPWRELSRSLRPPGDPEEKAAEILERLTLVPRQLESGRRNLTLHVPRFRELAEAMGEGASALFSEELPAFATAAPGHARELRSAAAAARAALDGFLLFLRDELARRPEASWAVGTATYDRILREQYLLDHDSRSLYRWGWEQLEKTEAELAALAARIDADRSWRELADAARRDHPPPERMIDAHQEWVDRARAHVIALGLVPIPWKERVTVVPRAEHLRQTSYYGSFSRAREADAEGVFAAEWQINPFEESWDAATRREYLLEHDRGVIIVTAPHETYAGHHVQSLYQLHNPRPLRRRFGTPVFSEGWGLYNEELMQETGFLPDERVHLRQLQLRLWRNARVVWDVGIHTGRMGYDEAVSLLSERVGFRPWAARLEVDGSAAAPGYRIGYFVGMTEILRLRAEVQARLGERFSLGDFHERLLRIGSLPPALVREALLVSLADS